MLSANPAAPLAALHAAAVDIGALTLHRWHRSMRRLHRVWQHYNIFGHYIHLTEYQPMVTVQKWRNRRRRDDRANGAKITEAMKVGDITFPLRITVTPECFPSLNQSKKILFCIEINETKPFLCSYYRHVDYRRAVMKKWRKKRMTCLPSISAPLSTTMSKLCSEWTIPPHIDNMM